MQSPQPRYVIYTSKRKAEQRHLMITDDARQANFLLAAEPYRSIIYHPTEDKAAIEVVLEDSTYVNNLPTPKYDYSIFFTDQEKARIVCELPAGWIPVNNDI